MLDKIKEAFTHPKTQDDVSALSGHHDRRTEVEVDKARHAEQERLADERIAEREAEQATQPAQPFHAPEIRGGREPLEEAAHHHGQHQAGVHEGHPDLQGGTHIPESELKPRLATVHTALRPNDPDQPGAMDGRPEPSTAGDDLAI